MSKYNRDWYQKNKEKVSLYNSRINRENYDPRKEKNRCLLKSFNITIDDYDYLFKTIISFTIA